MTKVKIGVFGCGNMGEALVLGIKAQYPYAEFYLFTPSKDKAQKLSQKVNGNVLDNILDMPKDLDWYLLAFKPQSLEEFEFLFSPEAKIISVLAGVNTSKLMTKFKIKKIARLMPNTPSSIGEGANLLYVNENFNKDECAGLYSLLGSTGTIFPMNTEHDLNLTTAFSGSGPALIFEMARIFETELTRMTEGRVPAREIVLKTFLGSSKLMNADKNLSISFLELREQVTSKGGVTYEALKILESNNLQDVFGKAFEAAIKRTIELSK